MYVGGINFIAQPPENNNSWFKLVRGIDDINLDQSGGFAFTSKFRSLTERVSVQKDQFLVCASWREARKRDGTSIRIPRTILVMCVKDLEFDFYPHGLMPLDVDDESEESTDSLKVPESIKYAFANCFEEIAPWRFNDSYSAMVEAEMVPAHQRNANGPPMYKMACACFEHFMLLGQLTRKHGVRKSEKSTIVFGRRPRKLDLNIVAEIPWPAGKRRPRRPPPDY